MHDMTKRRSNEHVEIPLTISSPLLPVVFTHQPTAASPDTPKKSPPDDQ